MNAIVRLTEPARSSEPLEGEVLPPLWTEDGIEVRCWRSPFYSASESHRFEYGLTLAEMVERALIIAPVRRYARVWIHWQDGSGSEEVPRENWARVRPKRGTRVEIKVVPGGGGGGGRKNILAIVLSLLVIVAAWYLTPIVAGAIGATSAAGMQAVFSALSTVGKALVSALIPPPKINSGNGQLTTERTFTLTGTSNRVSPFAAVPRAYGRTRYYPPLASAPYNEIVGVSDVYLRMLFDFGPGPLKISNIRIGDTPIENFDGWEIEVGHTGDLNGNQAPAGTYYAGFTNDRELKLYPTSVIQSNESIRMIKSSDVIRSFAPRIDQGLVVVTFPRGLIAYSNAASNPGSRGNYNTMVGCWYREIGTSTWIPMIPMKDYAAVTTPFTFEHFADDTTCTNQVTVTAQQNWSETTYLANNPDVNANYNPAGVTKRGFDHYAKIGCMEGRTPTWVNPASCLFPIFEMVERQFYYTFKTPKLDVTKEYEFRLYRPYGTQVPGGSCKVTISDEWWLNGVQSFRSGSPVRNISGHALMALRIKASDQLNGTLQNFSAQVEAILPQWNGSTWTSGITRNPAWAALDVLRGSANARPLSDSRIDLASWLSFSQWCDGLNSKGNAKAMFDAVFDAKTTVADALRQILSPQRASFVMRDGKYGVIWDDTKTTAVQMFTPKNSMNFSSEKTYIVQPHALKIRFNNEGKNYAEDEVTVYADGYSETNATQFEQMEAWGIVRPEQAYWYGRYMMATTSLRPELYTLDVDIEGLVCRRGDLVRVQHDVTRWGIASGRVIAVATSGSNVTSITLDETVLMEPSVTYAVRGRRSNNTFVISNVVGVTIPTETSTLTFTTPIAISSCVAVGDMVAFGVSSKETTQLLIRSIRRKDDLQATLELVDYSPDIFTADTQAIPAFDTNSTWQGAGVMQSPPIPVVDKIVSDETAMMETTSGWVEAFEVHIAGSSAAQQGTIRPDDYIELRYRPARTTTIQLDPGVFLTAGAGQWYSPTKKFLGNPAVVRVSDYVRTGDEFDIQVRRVTATGNPSDWSDVIRHTIVGRSTAPAAVSGLTVSVRPDDVLIYWSPNIEKDIVGYELRKGAIWASGVVVEKSPTTATTQYTLPPLASGAYTYIVRALDSFGLYSSADSLATFTISAPATPSVSYTFQGSNVALLWQDCQTSHRIVTYKVKRGLDAAIETKTTSAQFPVNWTGSLSFEVWAVDAAGNESAHATVSVSVSGAAAPSGLMHAIIGDAVQLSWSDASQGSVPVASYELRYGGSAWANATLLGRVSATSFLVSATWSGSRVFRLKAIDIAGNEGTETTRTVILSAPSAVPVTGSLGSGQYSLTWTAPSSLLPVKEYEIRYGASYAGGTLVATVQALNWTGAVAWTGTRSFWVVARTTTGLESTPAQLDLSVTAPNSPNISSAFIAGSLQLSWGVPASALPVTRYEVRYGGADWASSTFLTYADNTTYQTVVNFGGTRVYRVAAIDSAGNIGADGSTSVTIVSPSVPLSVASDVVDNNVLLKWSPPSLHSLPIDYYEVRVGSTWAGATSLGRKDGTFTSHFQTASGTYTYWVCAFDTAGNEGTPSSLSVAVNQPPDYVLKANFNSTFSGTATNGVVDGGAVYMPAITSQTFQQHFTNDSWASPNDQVNAGYPIYIQPTTTSDATYVETYDYGTTIPSANVTVTATYETVAGSITWSGRVEVSANGSTWSDVANPGWTGFATSFRYVRFTVKAVGTTRAAVGKLSQVNIRIDLKSLSDTGVVTCNSGDVGGTTVNFNRTFIDVDSITVTPRSTTACYAVVDFTDVANPTSFKILVFDTNGNRVTKTCGWVASGV